jgi:phosphoribosylformylglycinamidine synthase subunit PurQ / glutaminase
MQSGVITFPGSNCDRDMHDALSKISSKCHKIWHGDSQLPDNLDFIAIPGGFSYGDYLRCGSIAANSPIMVEVKKFAKKGGYILGVCNGFQILTEAGLLPGTLLRNKNLKFICDQVDLEISNKNTKFTKSYQTQNIILPIAHHDGNYFCDAATLKQLEDNQQIAFKYQNNPNGSVADIAGIFNKEKNILGMMPHPERAIDKLTGNISGLDLFSSLIG